MIVSFREESTLATFPWRIQLNPFGFGGMLCHNITYHHKLPIGSTNTKMGKPTLLLLGNVVLSYSQFCTTACEFLQSD